MERTHSVEKGLKMKSQERKNVVLVNYSYIFFQMCFLGHVTSGDLVFYETFVSSNILGYSSPFHGSSPIFGAHIGRVEKFEELFNGLYRLLFITPQFAI